MTHSEALSFMLGLVVGLVHGAAIVVLAAVWVARRPCKHCGKPTRDHDRGVGCEGYE